MFRPCIDLHEGKVKQIVGGTLGDAGLRTNFVSEKSAAWFAQLYQRDGLKGGHVIDPKNKVDAIRDVAIKDGKVAKIAVGIPANSAIKTVNVAGLYVTPGLIDIHVHVFWGLKKSDYAGADWAIMPD